MIRIVYFFLGCVFLVASCTKDSNLSPADAPVRSLADLPTSYQPILAGSPIVGRIKQEQHGGELSGEWRYNAQGKIIEWRSYRSGEVFWAVQYRYDPVGHLRFIQYFDNECMFSSHSGCKGSVKWDRYDEIFTDNIGRLQEVFQYVKQNNDWKVRSNTTFEHDNQNRPIKAKRYSGVDKNNLEITQEFTYDNQGNIIAVREINPNATATSTDQTFTFTFQYDKGLNPYAGTYAYPSAFFSSPNLQNTPGATYEYNSNGYISRIHQNNVTTEFDYY